MLPRKTRPCDIICQWGRALMLTRGQKAHKHESYFWNQPGRFRTWNRPVRAGQHYVRPDGLARPSRNTPWLEGEADFADAAGSPVQVPDRETGGFTRHFLSPVP